MARPGRPERNRTARSFRQLRRFHHVINSDKVFGTHSNVLTDWRSLHDSLSNFFSGHVAALLYFRNEPGTDDSEYRDKDDTPKAPVQGMEKDHADVCVASKRPEPTRLIQEPMKPAGEFAVAVVLDPDTQNSTERC